jgi:hypothetical protein
MGESTRKAARAHELERISLSELICEHVHVAIVTTPQGAASQRSARSRSHSNSGKRCGASTRSRIREY